MSPDARRRALRRVALAGLLLAGVATPVCGRATWEGRAELAAADEAAADGRLDDEILHLGRALRWRVPLASHDERALERLMEIGAEREGAGGGAREQALAAYREARGALLATRSLGVPHEDTFHEANARIAVLMAAQERELGTDLSGEGRQEQWHLELLEQVPGPDPTRGALAALAFVAWLVAGTGFVLRALDAQGRLRPRPALRWGGASLLLLIAWAVLLRLA